MPSCEVVCCKRVRDRRKSLADRANVDDTQALPPYRSNGTWPSPPTMISPGSSPSRATVIEYADVVVEGLGRICGRAVHDQQGVAGLDRQARDGGASCPSRATMMSPSSRWALRRRSMRARSASPSGAELPGIDGRERAIADALSAQGAVLHEDLPDLERLGPREALIAAGDQLVEAETLLLLDHHAQRPPRSRGYPSMHKNRICPFR